MIDVNRLVEPDRVHRSVYTDQAVFDAEMEHLFERTWIYCGHVSQIPKPGDYQAVRIGRQPMVMVRDRDGGIRVLYVALTRPTQRLVTLDIGGPGAWRSVLDARD